MAIPAIRRTLVVKSLVKAGIPFAQPQGQTGAGRAIWQRFHGSKGTRGGAPRPEPQARQIGCRARKIIWREALRGLEIGGRTG
jgi:hypothetical protein